MSEARSFPKTITWSQISIALLIVVAACALRSTVALQRAAYDPSFVPVSGRDDYNYWQFTQGFLEGDWPVQPHYYHPGPTYLLSLAGRLVDPSDPLQLVLFVALFDSLTVGAMIGAGWLLTQRFWGGIIAGAIYTIYPVAVFYSTTLLIAPLATGLVVWWFFLTLWQRQKIALWRTILAGLLIGLLALSRLNLVPIAGLYLLWLIGLRTSWPHLLLHTLIYSGVALLVVAPTTFYNYQASSGSFIPVATTGPLELYMANNRDSEGRHGRTPALDALDTDYMLALRRDIAVAPEHFVGLLGYKLAMFSSALEPGNNLTFQASADRVPLLDMLPGNFQWLLLLGLLGFGALWTQDRPAALLLAVILGWMLVSYLLIFAFGRLRFPAVAPLALLSAVFVVSAWESVRGKAQPSTWLRRYMLPLVLALALIAFSAWVLVDPRRLPPERTYAALPADAQALDVSFGEVHLRGWRPISEWPASEQGWLLTGEAYTVELFWEVAQPTERIYQFYLGYFDAGERYAALDRPLGTVSFPDTTTNYWQPQTIYGEIVSLRFNRDHPNLRSGQMRVGVWYWDEAGRIINVPTSAGESNVVLQSLAIFDPLMPPTLPEGLQPITATFGELIQLTGYDFAEEAVSGDVIDLRLSWQALTDIGRDYTVLVHVDDADGNLVAQGDNLPIAALRTQNWPPQLDLWGSLPVMLPELAGSYSIHIGLYDASGRLSIGTPDQRIRLGEIRVRP